MADSRDLSRLHVVTLDAKNLKVLSQPRPDDEMPSNVFGLFDLVTYLCIPRAADGSNGTALPGPNFVRLFVTTFDLIGTPWTITAAVTEISPPSTPWQGEARFDTLGVNLSQAGNPDVPLPHANVYFNLEWNSPLPFGVSATIGFTSP